MITAVESEFGTRVYIGNELLLLSDRPSGPYWKDIVKALGYSVTTIWEDEVPLDINGEKVTK